ncbi:hypothetical protein ACWIB8_03395 [Corynebacterium flavescens]
MSRYILAAAALSAACLLSACGSATVESAGPGEATSVPPLERSSAAASSTAASTSAKPSAAASEPAAEDQGAREVSEIPTSAVPVDDAEKSYLHALGDAGLNTEGVEDQIIGAGYSACQPEDNVTIPAVAGQLIEQERTSMSYEELSALITDQARTAFC